MANSIGQKIKELRKKKGITQEQLAELILVTPQAISKWERDVGYPDITQIVPLADAFGVSTDILLNHEEGKQNAYPGSHIYSAEFRLFDEILLWAWIE